MLFSCFSLFPGQLCALFFALLTLFWLGVLLLRLQLSRAVLGWLWQHSGM